MVGAMNKAFGVLLHRFEHDGRDFCSHVEDPTVPESLSDIVIGVVGLDTYPLSTPKAAQGMHSSDAFTPLQLREHYAFPQSTGKGQRIAILAFGATGFHESDIRTYFSTTLGINAPTINLCSVDGATCEPAPMDVLHDAIGRLNEGQTDFSYLDQDMMRRCRATMETTLDIQVAGAVANGARIDVYFAANDLHGCENISTAPCL